MGVNVTQMGGGGKKIAESTATTMTDVPAQKVISAKGIAKGSYDEQSKILLPYADVASAAGLTANKIVKGNTILGVNGSAKGKKTKQFSVGKGYTLVSKNITPYAASFVKEYNTSGSIGNLADETDTYYFIVNGQTGYIDGKYGKSITCNIPVDGTKITIEVNARTKMVITTILSKSFFDKVLSVKGKTFSGASTGYYTSDGIYSGEYFCLDVIDGYIKEIGIFNTSSKCYADYKITIEYWG